MFKEVTADHTFIQNDDKTIEVYKSTGNLTGLQPIYISDVEVETQKQFEVEVAYMLVYDLHNDHQVNDY